MRDLDLPDDAESISLQMRADGVYLIVGIFNSDDELIESHEYAIGEL